MGRHTSYALLSILVVVVLAGCGGSGDAGQVKASFAQLVEASQRRDVAGACDRMTAAFWAALAGQVSAAGAASGHSISATDCRAGLAALYRLTGNRSLINRGVSATDVVVHGGSASARTRGGSLPAPLKFVRVNGRWRIDCCAGRQLEQQAETRYRIPSPSMLPTLRVGQIVVSDNAALREHPPALGAIVALHPPAGADSVDFRCGTPEEGVGHPRACGQPTPGESGQTFIKRVVGLPGDRIAIVHGVVIRNGRPEPHTYKVSPCTEPSACNFPESITIPAGEYFVLGDNRGASADSRYWGPVKRSWLIGLVSVG
jgi:signal peptidase I